MAEGLDDELGAWEETGLPDTPPDLRVQLVFHVFTVNVAFALLSIVLASIPYFDTHVALFHTRTGLMVSVALAALSYTALACATAFLGGAPAYDRVMLGCIIAFALTWSAAVGFTAAALGNTAPIQFMLISFGQSISVVLYTRVSPRALNTHALLALLSVGGACMWIIGISGYVLEMDWPYAVAILVLGALLVVYNLRQIARTKDQYDASFTQGLLAIAHYFARDAAGVCVGK